MTWEFTLHVANCNDNGHAIGQAEVIIHGGTTGATTDYGDFVIANIDDEQQELVADISRDGYEPRTVTVYKTQASGTVDTCLHPLGSDSA